MARPLRYNIPGGLYHVTTRGNERCAIVRSNADRTAFVDRLADVVVERQWCLHSWVLMTNHLHLVLETPIPNLSEGMRDLLGPFAGRFNSVHERVGHLFQHRFNAKPVERETHLLELLRYVPLNPVRAGVVKSPGAWRWGSYRATAGLETAPPWLEIGWTLAQFHSDPAAAQRRFRQFVSDGRGVTYDPEAEAIGGWILGSAEFCRKVQTWIDESGAGSCHPRRQRRLVLAAFGDLVELVRHWTAPAATGLAPRSRGPARKLLADLGHEECGMTFEALGEALGTTAWAAAKLRKRSRELARSDEMYAELRESLRAALKRRSEAPLSGS